MSSLPLSATLREALVGARKVLLTGPLDPDGDSIGACLALARGARAISGTEVDVAGTPGFRYAWMPGADAMVDDERVAGPYDLAVVLDGDRRRLSPRVKLAFDAAKRTGLVDHHASTDPGLYDIAILDPHASSATELVWQILQDWGIGLDRDLAALLYTGLIFDTGGFRYSNTRPSCHRLAAALLETGLDHATIAARVLMERRPGGLKLLARVLSEARFLAGGTVLLSVVEQRWLTELGATYGDIEGIVDALVFTHGVELACLAVEREPDLVKLSLRSRSRVDVAELAGRLSPGGGGHPRAAGATIRAPLSELTSWLPEALGRATTSPVPGLEARA